MILAVATGNEDVTEFLVEDGGLERPQMVQYFLFSDRSRSCSHTEYEDIDFNVDIVKQYEAVREAMNSANLKISSLSLQIRLSS